MIGDHHHQHITRELFCEQKRRGVEHGPKVIRDAGLIDRLSALGKAAQLRNSVQLHVWAAFILPVDGMHLVTSRNVQIISM